MQIRRAIQVALTGLARGYAPLLAGAVLPCLFAGGCATTSDDGEPAPALPSVRKPWEGQKANLIVAGSRRAAPLQGKEWDDLRIGMGVSAILAQALYDTGCFALQEAQGEIRSRIEKTWGGAAPGAVAAADYTASVTVENFFLEDVSAFLGILGTGRKKTTMAVSVTLRNTRTGAERSAKGKGGSTTANAGALFVFEWGTVAFDETTVGRATKAAIYDAVARIDIP